MTNDPVLQRLREISWQRALTEAEQAELDACLKAHPELRADFETELALTASLAQLADPAVASNFTARVLQAVEREALAETHLRASAPWWRNLARRTRWAMGTSFAALVAVTSLLVHGYHVHERQELAKRELVKSVMLASVVSALPNTEVLTNFDAVRALSQAPPPDEQLLLALVQ